MKYHYIVMSKNCPFTTRDLNNIDLNSVPYIVGADIPKVPNGYSGVKFQMGGTTPPQDRNTSGVAVVVRQEFTR